MTQPVRKIVFGIRHTKHGCVVWYDSVSGRRTSATFRNTYQCAALTKAQNWVTTQRDSMWLYAEELSQELQFEIPPILDQQTRRKALTLPFDWWEAFRTQANQENLTVEEWLGEAGKAKLPPEVAATLSTPMQSRRRDHGETD